jgi:hypothetical protein
VLTLLPQMVRNTPLTEFFVEAIRTTEKLWAFQSPES